MSTFDVPLFDAVNRFAVATPWLHPFLLGYAAYGVGLFALLLLAGWWAARRSDEPARVAAVGWTALATLLAVALNQPVAHAVAEPRPFVGDPDVLVLAHRAADYSFPSDHAVMAGAVAAGLWLVSRRLGAVATAAALLLGASRVYVGVHYPHDVVAGLALGAAVTLTGWWLLHRPLTAVVQRLARTPLRPLLAG